MHFAYPPRKSSHPPAYPARGLSRSLSYNQRRQLKIGAIILCSLVFLILVLSRLFSNGVERIQPGTPEVVIVTLIDEENMSKDYIAKVQDNRNEYAARHGYATFFPTVSSYPSINDSPRTWSLVPALRHALTLHPHSTYIFALSPHALIMNPTLNLRTHILAPNRLEKLMLRDKPVVPPDSVIKTFGNLKGDRIDLVLTQDGEGLCPGSFVLKNGEWAQFFLETWFDPLYRSYNFQKAEAHALEHIIQWHPTILTKLALIPQRTLNTYNTDIASRGGADALYQDGDFVVRLVGCDTDAARSCEGEFEAMRVKLGAQKMREGLKGGG
ncbi:MAG: hypothetical protein LQ349_004026 [Xanthoria aureola]|nr:MAG: hypothetical protein LQ349_004026 [Xanthoria aureola]